MNIRSKLKIILPVILFESYYFIGYIWYFSKNGAPEQSLWVLIYISKIGIGYLVYLLYISTQKHLSILGPTIILLNVILTFVAIYGKLEQLKYLLMGSQMILLVANTFFLYRYYKNPEIINSYFERIAESGKYPTFTSRFHRYFHSIVLGFCVFIVAISGEETIVSWVIVFMWTAFYAYTERIIKTRKS